MGITRMNHAVLYVTDADAQARFYGDVLGFETVQRLPMGGAAGVFMRAPDSSNDHDIAFFGLGDALGPSSAGRDQVGLYHLAWEVPTLADLRDHAGRLSDAGALKGAADHGTTKALYAADPHGLEFEVSWIVPVASLTDRDREIATMPPQPLDIDAEIARFGEHTRGHDTHQH